MPRTRAARGRRGRGVWFGAVGAQGETGVGGQFHGVEVEGDLADGRVAEGFAARVVEAHVVPGPGGAELVAADDEFADQAGQISVAWGVTGFGAQQRDGGVD